MIIVFFCGRICLTVEIFYSFDGFKCFSVMLNHVSKLMPFIFLLLNVATDKSSFRDCCELEGVISNLVNCEQLLKIIVNLLLLMKSTTYFYKWVVIKTF